MTTRLLFLATVLGVITSVACGGGSSNGGTGGTGATGADTGGTGGSASGTGGTSGGAFVAIAPCGAAADYETGTTITFPGADSMSYSPKCLKTTVGSTVTFMPMAGATFEMFPLDPSRMRGNTSDSALQNYESATATSKAFTFGTAGSYAYYCRRAGSDEDGSGMAGVIWVE